MLGEVMWFGSNGSAETYLVVLFARSIASSSEQMAWRMMSGWVIFRRMRLESLDAGQYHI